MARLAGELDDRIPYTHRGAKSHDSRCRHCCCVKYKPPGTCHHADSRGKQSRSDAPPAAPNQPGCKYNSNPPNLLGRYRFRIRPRTIRLYNRCNRLPGRQSNTYHQCNECLTPQTIVINGGGIEDGSDQDTSCRILESKRLQTCSSIAYPLQT